LRITPQVCAQLAGDITQQIRRCCHRRPPSVTPLK
jgi:hypothetical protein